VSEQRIAIVPGSFDPITLGHLSIIKRAARDYDRVYVAVMINSEKRYMFTLEERKRIASACVEKLCNVEVISSEGWLWELARDVGACAIVKGYRNDVDLEYEERMAQFNAERFPAAKTILLKAEDGLTDVSSTAVRGLLTDGGALDALLPPEAIEEIKRIKK